MGETSVIRLHSSTTLPFPSPLSIGTEYILFLGFRRAKIPKSFLDKSYFLVESLMQSTYISRDFRKELQSYNWKFMSVSATNVSKDTIGIWDCDFPKKKKKKNHIWHIEPKIYIYKTNFTSHEQYLFDFIFYRNTKRTHINQGVW